MKNMEHRVLLAVPKVPTLVPFFCEHLRIGGRRNYNRVSKAATVRVLRVWVAARVL